jgi:hypothetical protein
VSQNGNWFNVYVCNITVETAGTLKLRVSDMVDALDFQLSHVAPGLGLGKILGSVLGGLGLSGALKNIPGLDVPVTLPAGLAGLPTQTRICS